MKQPILPRVAKGEEGAAEELVDRYSRILRWLASQHSGVDVDDAVQEILLTLWQNADKYDPEKSAESTFVSTVARRKLIDRHRRRTRRPITQDIDAVPEKSVGFHPDVEQAAEVSLALDAMESLRPAQRSVLRLSVLEGLNQREIANRLEMPLGTVKTHIRRGLIEMRELLVNGPAARAMAA